MLPAGALAVAVGIACFVLIALVSLRGSRARRRGTRDDGPILPLWIPYDDDGGGGDGGDTA
jgi:hypothetical protein